MAFRPSGESSYVSMGDLSICALRRIKDITKLVIERDERSVRSHSHDRPRTITTGVYPHPGGYRIRNQPDVGTRRLMDADKCDSFTGIRFKSKCPPVSVRIFIPDVRRVMRSRPASSTTVRSLTLRLQVIHSEGAAPRRGWHPVGHRCRIATRWSMRRAGPSGCEV